MRIISGKHKGRKISAPNNLPVRPTTDRSKEAIFNIIENRYPLNNIFVLDLFSGTGNIAYEFGSRGCEKIISVDKNQYCINFINKMSRILDLNIEVIKSDCLEYLKATSNKFDIIFADPPYNYNHYNVLSDLIVKKNLLRENGSLILEHNNSTRFDNKNREIRKYGNVHFSIFNELPKFE